MEKPANSNKEIKHIFNEGEKILCFHGSMIYEAKVC
jgi:hypothetical protein